MDGLGKGVVSIPFRISSITGETEGGGLRRFAQTSRAIDAKPASFDARGGPFSESRTQQFGPMPTGVPDE
jgi:hypothetical protein